MNARPKTQRKLPPRTLPARKLPAVMERLFAEHRYISALVRVLEQKSNSRVAHPAADYYLLRDIVGYVHDYPDHVHHPTEDRLFELVLRRRPELRRHVARLRREHREVVAETAALLKQLDELIAKPDVLREAAVLSACADLVRRQRAHIELENQTLFPAAIAALLPADWQRIEAQYFGEDDPLFGRTVRREHRKLYEYLLGPADRQFEQLGITRLLSPERLAFTGEVLARGIVAGTGRLGALGDEVLLATRRAADDARQAAGVAASLRWPAALMTEISRSLLSCGIDVARIGLGTARDTMASLARRA